MKNSITKITLIIAVSFLFAAFFSCRPKDAAVSASAGAVEVISHCAEYGRSDTDYFRADNSATSSNMSLSRERALTMVRQRLASNVEATVRSVTDRYVSEYDVGDRQEFSGKFENLTREVVNQKLRDVRITCERTFQKTDGRYTTYIAIEIDKETFFNGFDSQISRDEKLMIDYNKQRFENIFNEEMERMANERP